MSAYNAIVMFVLFVDNMFVTCKPIGLGIIVMYVTEINNSTTIALGPKGPRAKMGVSPGFLYCSCSVHAGAS